MKRNVLISIFCLLSFICMEIQAQEFSMQIDNKKRTYIVRLPQNYGSSQLVPLHLFLHGGGFTKEQAEEYYGFTQHADTSGYIIVYPQGYNGDWDRAGNFKFISMLIDTLCSNYNVDKQMIYVSGHSAGGVLVNILACELSHKIAAFGNICGFMIYADSKYYKPKQPVPHIKIHGTADDVIPYAGTSDILSVDSVMSFWKQNNKALSLTDSVEIPDIVKTDNSNVVKYIYGSGNSEIVFYKVINGGHDAPDWKPINSMGNTNRDINTPEVLWNFFKTHNLSGARVTFISNSGFLIESGNKKVLIDALGVDQYPTERIREKIINGIAPFNSIDLSLVTHDHGDHFDASFVANQLKNNLSTHLISPKRVESQLALQPDYEAISNKIIGITPDWNMQTDTSANGIRVKILRMHHDVATDIENNAYLFELNNLKILHIGDYTGNVLSELETFDLKHQNIDIAFVNYYCYFDDLNMRKQVQEGINAKYTILYHVDNADLARVAGACKKIKNTMVFSSAFENAYFNTDTSFQINKAPVLIKSIPDTLANVGQELKFRIENNTFGDDIGDFLTYRTTLLNGNELPEWLKFNPNTKYFSGTPLQEENLWIKVIITDFAGTEASDVFVLKVKQITDVDYIDKKPDDIFIFPNPASKTIQIKTSGLSSGVSYQLMDLNGKTVKQGKFESQVIDISELPKGIYMLNLNNNKGIFTEKIVIE